MKVLQPWKANELAAAVAAPLDYRTASGTWYSLKRSADGEPSAVNVAGLRVLDLTEPGNLLSILAPALRMIGRRFGDGRDAAEGLCARAELALTSRCGVTVTAEDFEALDLCPLIDCEEFDAVIVCWALGDERGGRLCVFPTAPVGDSQA